MTIFHVDSNQISAASLQAANTADEIRSATTAMMVLLEGLSTSWSGAASASFQELLSSWRLTQAQVEQNLSAIGTQLQQAAATYSEAESRASMLFMK